MIEVRNEQLVPIANASPTGLKLALLTGPPGLHGQALRVLVHHGGIAKVEIGRPAGAPDHLALCAVENGKSRIGQGGRRRIRTTPGCRYPWSYRSQTRSQTRPRW